MAVHPGQIASWFSYKKAEVESCLYETVAFKDKESETNVCGEKNPESHRGGISH